MTKRPIIGLTMDFEPKGSFSTRPYYALRVDYFQAIYNAGGLPVALPYMQKSVAEYMNMIDGLLVPGGNFGLDPAWYVASDEAFPYAASPRLPMDVALVKSALENDMPLLGICAGMQIMGSVLGGKMTRNIHTYLDTDIDHLNEKPREEVAHSVSVAKESRLYKIVNAASMMVNTAHTEALVSVPKTVTINAKAPDGTIEGIEIPGKTFAIGVQWHPEFFAEAGTNDFKILTAFIKAAAESRTK